MNDLVATEDLHLEPLKGHYEPDVILAGLYALAAHGGNAKRAYELLKETYGQDTPAERTLSHWRSTSFPRRYQHILTERTNDIETLVEHQLRESLRLNGLVKHQALQRLADNINTVDPKELGKTVQQLAVAEGVGLDKLLTLTGRPNHITETRNADEILKALEARYPTTQPNKDTQTAPTPSASLPRAAHTTREEDKAPAGAEEGANGSGGQR